jgi:hypothetical protein
MASANPNISSIVATTIQSRSKKIADNVTKNNAILSRLNAAGKVRTFSGGNVIWEELSFAENPNGGFYSGYDLLPVAASDVISAAEYQIKQYAVPVVISGLEQLQNSGKEALIDLMEARMAVAESTMANQLSTSIYGDGTAAGGKAVTGLGAGVVTAPTTGVYGGIDRATWAFWRNQAFDAKVNGGSTSGITSSNVQTFMNALWSKLIRGSDRPDMIVCDNVFWSTFMGSLQPQQRFMDPKSASLGFPTIKFMDADVVLDGGIGGACPANTAFFLNTKFLSWRPHAQRNMVPLSPDRRYSINQDSEVAILAWAGNLTCSGAQFQGRLFTTA